MDSDIGALTIIFTEFYYWLTVVIMFFIHIGFCMYEVGASRTKNMMHTLMKNTMVVPLVTVTFFFFGWWIYFAFPNGPFIYQGKGLIAAPNAVPWSELMGPHLGGPPASAGGDCRRDRALGARQRRVLGGVPAVLLDRGLDRLRRDHRAGPLWRLLGGRGDARLGHLDHRRRLGLALGRLDGQAARATTTPTPRA